MFTHKVVQSKSYANNRDPMDSYHCSSTYTKIRQKVDRKCETHTNTFRYFYE